MTKKVPKWPKKSQKQTLFFQHFHPFSGPPGFFAQITQNHGKNSKKRPPFLALFTPFLALFTPFSALFTPFSDFF